MTNDHNERFVDRRKVDHLETERKRNVNSPSKGKKIMENIFFLEKKLLI